MTGTPYYLLVFRVVGAVDFKVSVGMGSWRARRLAEVIDLYRERLPVEM
jgi:hypothetical protein